MDNSIERMLADEIETTLSALKTMNANTEQAKAELMKLARLQELRARELDAILKEKQLAETSMSKVDEMSIRNAELEQKRKQAEEELEMKKAELAQKEAELKEAKKGRWWKTVLDIVSIGAPLGVGLYGLKKGFEFEEEGKIYSSRTPQFVSGFMRLFGKKG